MTHRFSVPGEVELEGMIKQAFGKLPVADQSKLSEIEGRLLLKAKENKTQKKNRWNFFKIIF